MAIYKRIKKDISGFYMERDAFTDPFEHFNELLISLEKFHQTYSFFNLDVLEISRKYPKVPLLKSAKDALETMKLVEAAYASINHGGINFSTSY